MALSMDEQRMLAEIERRLAAEDPGLASCLTTFRRPSPASVLRSPRARIIGSLFTVLLVALVSLMIYAMIPFRAHPPRPAASPFGAPGNTAMLNNGASSQPHGTQQASSSAKATIRSGTSVSASNQPAGRPSASAAGRGQGSSSNASNPAASPTAKP